VLHVARKIKRAIELGKQELRKRKLSPAASASECQLNEFLVLAISVKNSRRMTS
jgi:hypothetical protein